MTPCMAAGVTNTIWTMKDLLTAHSAGCQGNSRATCPPLASYWKIEIYRTARGVNWSASAEPLAGYKCWVGGAARLQTQVYVLSW